MPTVFTWAMPTVTGFDDRRRRAPLMAAAAVDAGSSMASRAWLQTACVKRLKKMLCKESRRQRGPGSHPRVIVIRPIEAEGFTSLMILVYDRNGSFASSVFLMRVFERGVC